MPGKNDPHPSLEIYRTCLRQHSFVRDTRHTSLHGEEFWYRAGRRVVVVDNDHRPAGILFATLAPLKGGGFSLSLH